MYSAGTSGPNGEVLKQLISWETPLLLAEIEQSGAESNTVDFVWDTVNRNSTTVSDWNSSALMWALEKKDIMEISSTT